MIIALNFIFKIFLISSILLSCSSSNELKSSNGDLVETFKISNEFETFKVKSTDDYEKEVKKDQVTTPVNNEVVKKIDSKVVVKKKKEKKKVETIQEETVASEVVGTEVVMPEGYPPELVELDKKNKYQWDIFTPKVFPGEVIKLRMKYLGITVGHFTLRTLDSVMVGENKAFHFKGVLKSESYYEMLYKLDDSIESFVDEKRFVPIKFSLKQRESKKNVDDLQLFDSAKKKVFHFYRREKGEKITEHRVENFKSDFYHDFLSAIYFIRGLPMEKAGAHYSFPVFNKGKMFVSKAKVIGIEKIKVGEKWYEAYHVAATNHFPGAKENKGEMMFWFSKDFKRTLLRLVGTVKIGEIEGELVSEEGH